MIGGHYYLGKGELCVVLGICESTLWYLIRNHQFPVFRILPGGPILASIVAVSDWLETQILSEGSLGRGKKALKKFFTSRLQPPPSVASDDYLQGFKEIGAFLQVSEPTVRRYYKDHGLPLIPSGHQRWASKSKLLAWLDDQSKKPGNQGPRERPSKKQAA
jgi:predicted DNA-binding transcriptional regulator AlpA